MSNNIESLLEILPGNIIYLDKNNVIKASNLGKEYNDLLVFDVLEEYEINTLKEQLEYSKSSKSSCEYITTNAKPFKKWYKNIIKPSFDNMNRFDGYTLYKEDITEKKLLEEKLFKTQFIYYEAFEAIGIGIWEIELKNDFFIISNALKKMLKTSSGVISTKKWEEHIHKDDIENVKQIFKEFMSSKINKLLEHTYRLRVNDKYIWLKSTGKVIQYNISKEPVKLLGVVQDVTKQVLVKKSLKKYNEELEEKVKERTLEFKDAKKEAEIANVAKSEFLSNISHEFFTPLNIILNNAKIVSKKLDGSHEVQKSLENIEKSGKDLNELVKKMLYLVNLDLDNIKFKMYKTDIINLLNSVILEIKNKHSIDVKTNILSERRYVYCDSMNIKIIILELIENSIKYMHTEDREISINVTGNNKYITFEIKDNGIGVKKNELNTIFDRFFLGTYTKDGSGGKGLGLSLCKEIIKKHNGEIWAKNNSDSKGLTVYFTLPVTGENNA